jgi:hypothetical protein
MAGEKFGLTYEAMLAFSFELAGTGSHNIKHVNWGVTPTGMTIDTDFTIGPNPDDPELIVLVAHSGSEKESNRKFWRNVGELVEAKTLLPRAPKVVSVVFDDTLKPGIRCLGEATFDGQLVVPEKDYGPALIQWVREFSNKLPREKMAKLAQLRTWVDSREKIISPILKALTCLAKDLKVICRRSASHTDSIWAMVRARRFRTRLAKETSFRRGMGKLSLLPSIFHVESFKKAKLSPDDSELALALGFASRSLRGSKICDPDIQWVFDNIALAEAKKVMALQPLERMQVWSEPLRALSQITEQCDWVSTHWLDLTKTPTLLAWLEGCHNAPASLGIDVPAASKRVWLFHLLLDVLKSLNRKQQAFGLSVLMRDLRELRNDKEHENVVISLARARNVNNPVWRDDRGISLGLGDWANGPSGQNFPLYPEDLIRVTDAISRRLREFTVADFQRAVAGMREVIISTNLESRLLTYRLFDPLKCLITEGLTVAGIPHTDGAYSLACFSEYARDVLKAKLDPRSGGTTVIHAAESIINWQSCTDSGRDHKKKELCGRAVALRFSWDNKRLRFTPRPGVKKLLLLVDGTWRQSDMDSLVRSGWDEIFYPDEIEKLTAAIV